MNALQAYAKHLTKNGWTITSMTDQQFIATKRKDISCLVLLIGFVGLLFFLIPGLLILLLGYVARGTETKMVTAADAEAWLARRKLQAQREQAELEARKAAQEERKVADAKKYAELSASGSPLRFWYKLSRNQRGWVFIALLIIAFIIPLLISFLQ